MDSPYSTASTIGCSFLLCSSVNSHPSAAHSTTTLTYRFPPFKNDATADAAFSVLNDSLHVSQIGQPPSYSNISNRLSMYSSVFDKRIVLIFSDNKDFSSNNVHEE